MPLYKNVASQKLAVFAWDTVNNTPKTGDTGNISSQVSKDGGATAASDDTNPTELDATDAKGVYLFSLTQAETNCDLFILSAVSSTTGIKLDPVIVYTSAVTTTRAGYLDELAAANIPSDIDDVLADTSELQVDDIPGTLATIAGYIDAEIGQIIAAVITNAAGTDIAADIIAIKAETTLIVADTSELQTDDYPTSIAAVKSDTAAILADTDDIGVAGAGLTAVPYNSAWDADIQSECADALTAYDPPTKTEMDTKIDALNNLSAAQVNAQVLDVLNTDTFAEPGQGAPPATTTLVQKLSYLYKFLRNKIETTATVISIYDDAGTTVDQKSTISDDGTTFTRGEFGTGP